MHTVVAGVVAIALVAEAGRSRVGAVVRWREVRVRWRFGVLRQLGVLPWRRDAVIQEEGYAGNELLVGLLLVAAGEAVGIHGLLLLELLLLYL
jgi:hypothetical protein